MPENAQKQFFLTLRLKSWILRGEMGYFVNLNFMPQKMNNFTSFETCSHIYKEDYYQNVVKHVKYEL